MNYPRSCLSLRGPCNTHSANVTMINIWSVHVIWMFDFRVVSRFSQSLQNQGKQLLSRYLKINLEAMSDFLSKKTIKWQQNDVWPTEFYLCQWKYPETFIYSREIPTEFYIFLENTHHAQNIFFWTDNHP